MRRYLTIPVLAAVLGATTICQAGENDWTQAGANAQRTAHVSAQPNPPYKLAWVASWPGETITHWTSPVVFDDTCYVGTENGVVHAIDLGTGKDSWARHLGTSIVNSLACDRRFIYAACVDGTIRALHRDSGKIAWKTPLSRRGFIAAPLLMEEALYIGGRDGIFYSLNAGDGKPRWRFEADGPIDQTAAGADGKVVFVTDRMTAWCLDAATGEPAWKHEGLPGNRPGYWPTIYKGRVIVALPDMGHQTGLQRKLFWPVVYNRPVETVHYKAKTVKDMVTTEQDLFVAHLREHPGELRLFMYDLADGTKPCTPGFLRGSSENGEPLVLAGDGRLYGVFRTSAATRGLMNITHCAIGHFNIETGRLDEPVVAGDFELTAIVGTRSPFELTSDEPVIMASGGDLLFGSRIGAGLGAVNVRTRKAYKMPDKSLPRATDNHPAPAMPVVSGKYVLHTKFHQILCIRGQ